MKNRTLYWLFFLLITSVITLINHFYSPQVIQFEGFLIPYGSEAVKIRDIIKNYSKEKDSLKLKSLVFLINNARFHEDDTSKVNALLLESTVNDAVEMCRKQLITGELTFNNFCEYILPYRVANEPIENWRAIIRKRFSHIVDSVKNNNYSVVQVCSQLNNEVRKGFIYSSKEESGLTKNWTRLFSEKKGDCIDMTSSIIYPLRAFGIPVSTDYITCWGNINGKGHAWNALIFSDSIIPFMGIEENPNGGFNPFRLIQNKKASKTTYRLSGKVLRRTFSINKNLPVNDPIFINQGTFVDVTKQYFKVTDLIISNDKNRGAKDYYYICVYTYNNWVPIYFGEKRRQEVVFRDMAHKVLYLPIVYENRHNFLPIGDPCIIKSSNKVQVLKPDTIQTIKLIVKSTKSKETQQLEAIAKIGDWSAKEFGPTMEKIADGKVISQPINGKKYELEYWKNGWLSLGIRYARHNQVTFLNVPSNALYRIVARDIVDKERVFTYEEGKQIWW